MGTELPKLARVVTPRGLLHDKLVLIVCGDKTKLLRGSPIVWFRSVPQQTVFAHLLLEEGLASAGVVGYCHQVFKAGGTCLAN